MKRIFIFPTVEEAKAFILTEPKDPVFVAGVGMAEIAAATIRAVKAKKPQLAVLCGIAGVYDRGLEKGEVVEVVTERVAGIPERYGREYETTGPDTGLRLAAGVTVSRSAERAEDRATADAGVEAEADAGADADLLPEVENMEGAAFFAVCEALGVEACQIRAVSNYVGEPFEEWAVELAVKNLTEQLIKIYGNNE